MARVNKAFGDLVRAKLAERKLTLRGARNLTEVDYGTIWDITKNDYVPVYGKVVQLARRFGEDPNEWLKVAGYEPVEPTTPAFDPAAALGQATLELLAVGRGRYSYPRCLSAAPSRSSSARITVRPPPAAPAPRQAAPPGRGAGRAFAGSRRPATAAARSSRRPSAPMAAGHAAGTPARW